MTDNSPWRQYGPIGDKIADMLALFISPQGGGAAGVASTPQAPPSATSVPLFQAPTTTPGAAPATVGGSNIGLFLTPLNGGALKLPFVGQSQLNAGPAGRGSSLANGMGLADMFGR